MATPTFDAAADLVGAIERAIQESADRIREEAIKAAVADFETALRKEIGASTISLANHYWVSRKERELVITVQIPKDR